MTSLIINEMEDFLIKGFCILKETDILPTLAVIASALTAVLTYRFNQKQSQQKFKTDLYNMIVHLAGFVNHIQVLYQYHDSDLGHMMPVIETIMNYGRNHSNILDVDQGFYYNDHFHPDIIFIPILSAIWENLWNPI